MPSSTRDTTWTVMTTDGQAAIVELDVRVYGDYNTPQDDPYITDVKALWRKHGQLIESDLPEDLLTLAKRDLQRNQQLMADWAQQIAEEEAQERLDNGQFGVGA